ncbi:MAG: bacterioferritin [Tannerella sp.]|jgi:bacterioferritin|nr:bacterioferritin [Tannerella sp.]
MEREKSIKLLNTAVNEELTAVHQYMYFHFHCEDLGYELLSQMFLRIAIVEMNHVEMLAERILYLKGDVEMIPKGKIAYITDPKEMLEKACEMETGSIDDYNAWAQECGAIPDSASKALFEDLVKIEEKHQDQFDTELDNLKKFGNEYLALQSVERSKQVASGKNGG